MRNIDLIHCISTLNAEDDVYKVVGYIRVSGEAQDLERQRTLIKNYCTKNGYYLIKIIEDNAISGAVANRAGLNEVLSLQQGDTNCIVVSELSRISRQEDVMETLMKIHQIISKFDLVMLDEPEKIYKAGEKLEMISFLTLAIKAYGAAEERKKIVSRMKTGKQVLVEKMPLTVANSNIYYGFKKVLNPQYTKSRSGEPHYLMEVDEEKMSVVKDVFTWIADGMSATKVCEKLNTMGIKAPHGGEMNPTFVLRMIHKEIYKGVRKYSGEHFNTGTEYIPAELWERANAKLKENNARADKFTKHINPLKGLLVCPCGCPTTIIRTSCGFSFGCVSKTSNGKMKYEPCQYSSIRANVLLAILWFEIKQIVSNEDFFVTSNKEIDRLAQENRRLEELAVRYENEIQQKENEQSRIVENIATSTSHRVIELLNKKVEKIDEEISRLQEILTGIRQEEIANNEIIENETMIQIQKDLDGLTMPRRKEIFSSLIEQVQYCSYESRIGYIVINYKNGYESVYVFDCTNVKNRRTFKLVPACRFNPETKKVRFGLQGSTMDFSQPAEEFSPLELKNAFELEGWEVTQAINFEPYE
ncbi:MAG: recombinase family protein [Bacteroidaceae bacterium]|nr:recombinase family protein [Bacteroidaceae bacterium]